MNPCAMCDNAFHCMYIRDTLDMKDACMSKFAYEAAKQQEKEHL